MSSKVIGKRFQQLQCGKHLGDTKKKFRWVFEISDREYDLQVTSSALSGKRVVTLNHQQIYSEKNILNFNFDFSHNIEGHCIRITKIADKVNNFTLRIDNQQFNDLTQGRSITKQYSKKQTSKQQNFDPFSQFSTIAKKSTNNSSQFDQFDFDNFQSNKPSSKIEVKKNQQQIQSNFGNSYTTNQFQTNIFDMDGPSSNDDFSKKFQQNETDLLSADNFATNTYSYNNNYMDLKNNKEAPSQLWSIDFQTQQSKQKTWKDHISPDFTAKQITNKIKMTAQETKNKIMGYQDSLI